VSEFNLFVYGTLRSNAAAADLLAGCELIGTGTVTGTLYDIDGRFPALLRYGSDAVHGEIWRCPADLLPALDAYEGTAEGMFRRIADYVKTQHGERVPCWVYAAGPALSRRLTPDRCIPGGAWQAPALQSVPRHEQD
jgi:gamma-glutamylcyclotransferase (GGCT)/AIG2-like uncharacterized protein YtfP